MITPRGVAKNPKLVSASLDDTLEGLDNEKTDIANLSPEDRKRLREAITQAITNTEKTVDNLNDVISELQSYKGN